MKEFNFEADCTLDEDGYLTLKIKGKATAELRLMIEQECAVRGALGLEEE